MVKWQKKRNFIPKQNSHDLLVGTLWIGIPSLLYFRIFLGIVETIVGVLLCCGVGLFQRILNLLY